MTPAIRFDFRSDTVTRPSEGMRAAMSAAPVGDDVFGDDPTVKKLEHTVAELLGKEAGLFVSSGTQSNLLAIMSQCQRGEEYICGQEAHAYLWEAGGAAVLGSVQPQPIPNEADGSIDLAKISAAIKIDDPHFAITRLIAIENTIGGRVLPLSYMNDVAALAKSKGLLSHLDGARLVNAAKALNASLATLAAPFDTISLCLSKGLGAPIGSVLAGPADTIARAKRLRKMLGGSMRQVGVIAAAGLYAIEHNIARIGEDHDNAAALAAAFDGVEGVRVVSQQTNMVFVDLLTDAAKMLPQKLRERGIACSIMPGGTRIRLVTHLDIDRIAIAEARAAIQDVMKAAA